MTEDITGRLRFLGRHRCPRCRMPLRAEEITCALCQLQIVFVNNLGEVMIQMMAIDDPDDWDNPFVQEYQAMLAVENAGDIYFPRQYFPTEPQHADVVQMPDGSFRVRYANKVTLDEIRKPDGN